MPFLLSTWQEEFPRLYCMPEGLADIIKGYEILYDEESQSALIAHPLHHSEYPDSSYTLLMAGSCLGVTRRAEERTPNGVIPEHIRVHFGSNSIDRQLVFDTLRRGMAARLGLDDCLIPISAAPRYRGPPKPPPKSVLEWFQVFTVLAVFFAFMGYGIFRYFGNGGH